MPGFFLLLLIDPVGNRMSLGVEVCAMDPGRLRKGKGCYIVGKADVPSLPQAFLEEMRISSLTRAPVTLPHAVPVMPSGKAEGCGGLQ